MAYLPKQLAQSCVASTTETTVYTVPTGTSCIVKQIMVANVTGTAAVTSLSIVDSGGTAGVTNRVYEQLSVPANSTVSFDLSQVIASGGFISVKQGTSSAITTTVSGVEFGSAALVKDFAQSSRTSGNITANSTTWADLDTGLDLTLNAAVGDVIQVGLSARMDSEAIELYQDCATVVAGSPVNYFGTAGGATERGIAAWEGNISTTTKAAGGICRTLTADDISNGTVTLRLRYRGHAAGNKTVWATTAIPLHFFAINHGIAAVDAVTADTWAPYTPTWTNLTVGNGTQVARYTQTGKTVTFRVSLTWGSTTSITAGQQAIVSLPVAAHASGDQVVSAYYLDATTRHWVGNARIGEISASTAALHHTDASGAGNVSNTSPFTWTTSDILVVEGTYEAA